MTDWQLIQKWAGVAPDGVPGPATAKAIIAKAGITVPKPTTRKLADSAAFFVDVRAYVKGLDQTQVDTINGLLGAASHWPVAWVAYALATAWHECYLKPIKEFGGAVYFNTRYGPQTKVGKALGNVNPGDGAKFAGRGLVQLTGRTNYKNAGAFLGLDLLSNPDLALEPANATRILVWGMEGGKFTGKSLKDYLPATAGAEAQFTNARRIINGTDKAAKIAGHAMVFQRALIRGAWQ